MSFSRIRRSTSTAWSRRQSRRARRASNWNSGVDGSPTAPESITPLKSAELPRRTALPAVDTSVMAAPADAPFGRDGGASACRTLRAGK